MSELPANVYSVETVRHLDQCAIEREGIAGYVLMSRAAAFCYRQMTRHWPESKRCVVLCGAGNNAGDGYVVARLAMADGRLHSVLSLSDPQKLTGDARQAFDEFMAAGGEVRPFDAGLPADADLLVDALLGTGLERPLEGRFAAAVDEMNSHPAPTVAVDIPTGIHGDTGNVMGTAVRADLTASFVGLKSGLFLADGRQHAGRLTFTDLGIPPNCFGSAEPLFRLTRDTDLAACLPSRNPDSHKGDFGHVLIVGGAPGMSGAARLAGEAALVSGAGRVSIATHPAHAAYLNITRPELMCHAMETPDQLTSLIATADVIAVGPGLGKSDWSRQVYEQVLSSDRPAFWDADALNLLAADPVRSDRWVLTPHPGEAARLLNSNTAAIQAARLSAVQDMQARYGGVAVLKGAGTLISDGDSLRYCDAGNPGMATAGMGDVLTGIIAAMIAQGLTLSEAAAAGVHVHARAGDLAAGDCPRGLMASDLTRCIRGIVNP